jgi:cellulose 1,4-beta-cellobiosidase
MPLFGHKHQEEWMEQILEQLKSINKHQHETIMLFTELVTALTSLDASVKQIATAVTNTPAGTVPQPAVDALNQLTTDLAALAALVTPTGVPAVPTSLTATAQPASIALSWSPVPGAVSYNVKSSSVAGGPYTSLVTPSPITSPTFVDTSTKSGVAAFYVVSAVNAAGESANSSEVTATAS